MSKPGNILAQAARNLLAIHAKGVSPEEWEKMSPAERRLLADTFSDENLAILREVATWEDT